MPFSSAALPMSTYRGRAAENVACRRVPISCTAASAAITVRVMRRADRAAHPILNGPVAPPFLRPHPSHRYGCVRRVGQDAGDRRRVGIGRYPWWCASDSLSIRCLADSCNSFADLDVAVLRELSTTGDVVPIMYWPKLLRRLGIGSAPRPTSARAVRIGGSLLISSFSCFTIGAGIWAGPTMPYHWTPSNPL